MLDLKETWENLLMWLLCLCTSLLQEIFALYGLWVAIHCFENKNVKLHAYLGKKSVLLSEVVVLSSTFVFSMKAYIYSVTAQSRKPRSKRSSCLSGELLWSSQKKSGLYGMTNTQLVWRKIYIFLPCHEHGTKKKFRVTMRNQTSDLWILCFDALTNEPQRLHCERGLLWHASCILLGLAMWKV